MTATQGPPDLRRLPAPQALAIPVAFTLALAAFGLLPSVRANPRLLWSILGAAAVLLAGHLALLVSARSRGRTFTLDIVLRKQHYLQACAQGSVLLYWGYYWRPVYHALPLLAAQLAFAYSFDMLLAWARRDDYTLGFAPFPVIFSINLFLWFKPDWFYLQFLMIAVGFAAKELIRWNKDGRRTHIFNPSSFPLGLFSLVLILTGATGITYGPEIAETQFNPPHIYLFLFLIGLPGQFLFGVTSMTMSAALTTYLFGLVYFWLTGTYFFIDSYIPIAVFLGMHLLFTDPSTSPRTELGRIMFGMLYGLGTVAFYSLLGHWGVPTFYDKLLPVPILNLAIQLIDRVARSGAFQRIDPARLARSLAGRPRHVAYIAVWAVVFIVMSAAQGVGDIHRGHYIPFWQQACADDKRDACATLAFMESTYCDGGSAWACNDLGVLRLHKQMGTPAQAALAFQRACGMGLAVGCQNRMIASTGVGKPASAPPRLADYPIVLNEGKGPVASGTPLELYLRACDQGWLVGCESAAFAHLRGQGTPRDPARAVEFFDKACVGGLGSACSNVGFMFKSGDGVAPDEPRATGYLRKACDRGFKQACHWLEEQRPSTY